MSNWQATLESTEHDVFGTTNKGSSLRDKGSSLNLVIVLGFGLLAFGAALFGEALFHAFQNGTCSTTGYDAHYGPVPHCAKGIGWWMLMLMSGIVVAGIGAVLSRTLSTLMTPVLFVAVGAPFIALALRGGNSHLLQGASSSTGNLSAGIFGGCFVFGGLVWGAFVMRSALSRVSGSATRVGGLLAALAGVGAAFAIAASVAGGIGPTGTTALQSSPGITQGSDFGGGSSAAGQANSAVNQANHTQQAITRANAAAARRANAAVKQATAQAQKLTKLAACVSAAGANTARIQRCETKYMP